jgi:hypothetical protein
MTAVPAELLRLGRDAGRGTIRRELDDPGWALGDADAIVLAQGWIHDE